jgi:hypothetical protein
MTSSVMQTLAALSLATSIAVVVMALLRRLVRRIAGIQVAYWLWLLVPVSALAVLLPPLRSEIGGSNRLAGTEKLSAVRSHRAYPLLGFSKFERPAKARELAQHSAFLFIVRER